jgi:hypothetical protein
MKLENQSFSMPHRTHSGSGDSSLSQGFNWVEVLKDAVVLQNGVLELSLNVSEGGANMVSIGPLVLTESDCEKLVEKLEATIRVIRGFQVARESYEKKPQPRAASASIHSSVASGQQEPTPSSIEIVQAYATVDEEAIVMLLTNESTKLSEPAAVTDTALENALATAMNGRQDTYSGLMARLANANLRVPRDQLRKVLGHMESQLLLTVEERTAKQSRRPYKLYSFGKAQLSRPSRWEELLERLDGQDGFSIEDLCEKGSMDFKTAQEFLEQKKAEGSLYSPSEGVYRRVG